LTSDPAFQENTDPDTDPDLDPGLDDQKLKKKIQLSIFYLFLKSKITIYLSQGFHRGCPTYRRSLSPQKRTSSTSKKLNF
jgi:hypothetical protein